MGPPLPLCGEETIRELKRLDPEAKAIVSSGYSTDPIMAHFADHGFDGVLTKPYLSEEVSEVLNKVLGTTPDKQ